MKNHLLLGNWNALCDSCGRKFKALDLQKRWDGLMVCREDFEQRHPQDLLKVQREKIAVPWSRPYAAEDTYIPETLWTNTQDVLGLDETMAKDVSKVIDDLVPGGGVLNAFPFDENVFNATVASGTPSETILITETLFVTLGREFAESTTSTESTALSFNKVLSDSLSISEDLYFAEEDHAVDSMTLSESKFFDVGSSLSDTMTSTESLSFTLSSSTALNAAALNLVTLG